MTTTAEPLTNESIGAMLSEQQAREIFHQGEEAAVFALLELAKQLRQAQGTSSLSSSTPSGMKPLYQKPTTSQRRKKNGGSGRKVGHVGRRRKTPEHIDRPRNIVWSIVRIVAAISNVATKHERATPRTFRKTLRRS